MTELSRSASGCSCLRLEQAFRGKRPRRRGDTSARVPGAVSAQRASARDALALSAPRVSYSV
eukprot:6183971-Pleurochrysis_carterae.AAC.2